MGKFNTHGGYFAPKGYFKVNEGGSHEENPNGGVQIGVDEQGVPNMLEEGEPVFNDYVYSDNITADEDVLKKFNIPTKYAGKLYSQIADAFVDEAEERPNDPISNNGLNAMLVRLADAQEEQKAIKAKKDIEAELAAMSPEELAQLEQELAAQQQAEEEQAMQQEQMAQEQAIQEQGAAEEIPVMACGGKMKRYDTGGELLSDPPEFVRDNTRTALNLGYGAEPDLSNVYVPEGENLLAKKVREFFLGPDNVIGGSGSLELISPAGIFKGVGAGLKSAGRAFGRGFKAGAKATAKKVAKPVAEAVKTGETMTKETAKAAKTTAKVAKDAKNSWWIRNNPRLTTPLLVGSLATSYFPDWEKNRELAEESKNPANSVGVRRHVSYEDLDNLAMGGPINRFDNTDGKSRLRNTGYTLLPGDGSVGRYFPYGHLLRDDVGYGDLSPLEYNKLRLALATNNAIAQNNAVNNGASGVVTFNDKPNRRTYLKPVDNWEKNWFANTEANALRDMENMLDSRGRLLLVKPDAIKQPEARAQYDYTAALDRLNNAYKTAELDEALSASDAMGNEGPSALPTWGRYAGIVSAGLRGLYNAFQKPDKYNIPHLRPVLPEGQMNLVDPFYNPLDENQAVNDVLTAGAGTTRGLMNSGLGVNTPAALLAADYNLGRNIGNARVGVWDANNQRRNQVIAQKNANAQALGNFNYGINRERAGILNDFAYRNLQNDLTRQRLNYAAEQEKANAVNSGIDAIAQGLAGIGRENFAMNQINLNEALDYMLRNGYDVTYKGKKITRNGGTLLRKYKK